MGGLAWLAVGARSIARALPGALLGGVAGAIALSARADVLLADTLLQEAGTIYPAESTHTFVGVAGQPVTITLDSTDFDPVLTLLDASGNEVAFNDDFGGSFNSKIILRLPADGTYTVVAGSFSGQGGDYDLVVRTATEFELTYAEAEALHLAENYPAAIAAFTEAIDLDPSQSSAYLGRATALLSQVYLEQGDAIETAADIPPEVRALVINDFEQAADLLEASGSQSLAASLREQASLLRSTDLPN